MAACLRERIGLLLLVYRLKVASNTWQICDASNMQFGAMTDVASWNVMEIDWFSHYDILSISEFGHCAKPATASPAPLPRGVAGKPWKCCTMHKYNSFY
jgi:hypothetical protein